MGYRSVVVEADGGSRGNPGRAAYGAVLKDAATGTLIAEKAATIGIATNNVAEYSGLVAGLELYREHADGAELEVRMDSKLVVEQMSGRWKIKHPDLRPLAFAAHRLAPPGTTYTWIPRERNTHADRILNDALDGVLPETADPISMPQAADREGAADAGVEDTDILVEAAEERDRARPQPPWERGEPTTLILVRHGETDHTRDGKFSGLRGADPALNEEGRAQVRATGEWLAPMASSVDAIVSSPLRRTRESAEILAGFLERPVEVEEGIAEAAFGAWDGLTFAEARALDEGAFDKWLGSMELQAGGDGESVEDVERRVRRARDRLISRYPGQTVVATSHVTPIKLLVKLALDMPLTSLFRTELSPASVTVISWYPDGHPVLRLFNGGPTRPPFH